MLVSALSLSYVPRSSLSPSFDFKQCVYVHVSLCRSVRVRAGAGGSQRGPPDPLALELQGVVSCPRWVLETKFLSPARAVGALHFRVISPASSRLPFNPRKILLKI